MYSIAERVAPSRSIPPDKAIRKLIIRTRPDVTPSLVEKTLGSVRAGTKKKGTELCCMYVEVENSGEGVIVSDPALNSVGRDF